MGIYIKNYPRPQLVRTNWINLNGTWDFAFDDQNMGEMNKWMDNFTKEREIEVPFTYETKKSGIGEETRHDHIWYQKEVEISEKQLEKKRMLLHLEGSDFSTKVWINGRLAGKHKGGYSRFTFDISNLLVSGTNKIIVKVDDSYDMQQPRGKQRWMKQNFGCWYVQTTGIWKTVWMEEVSMSYINRIKLTPDINSNSILVETDFFRDNSDTEMELEAEITYKGTKINKSVVSVKENRITDKISVFCQEEFEWGVHLWSCEEPELYDLTLRLKQNGNVIDEVFSYFGMREIRIEEGNILLNGHPLYQRLILDQGYWKDSHLTPPDEEALKEDIEKIHEMGYNGLRKHMKIEDERFLYWCDVKGMLVWSEMAACYEYGDDAIVEFTKEWMDVVKQNYNHPCIITWTPFNESWGIRDVETNEKEQHFTEGIYHLTKSMDPMRPVIVNDGWEHTVSDIITLHDYEEDGDILFERYQDKDKLVSNEIYHNSTKSVMANGYQYKGQPIILSEYGGIAFCGSREEEWGYGKMVSSEEEFLKRFDKITSAIKKIPYVTGYCYTQVSDVQQEINGLLKENREYKISPEKIADINTKQVGIHKINN